MRLFKMLAYALLGYALYEFIRGMLEEPVSEPPVAPRSPQQTTRPRQDNSPGHPARPASKTS